MHIPSKKSNKYKVKLFFKKLHSLLLFWLLTWKNKNSTMPFFSSCWPKFRTAIHQGQQTKNKKNIIWSSLLMKNRKLFFNFSCLCAFDSHYPTLLEHRSLLKKILPIPQASLNFTSSLKLILKWPLPPLKSYSNCLYNT